METETVMSEGQRVLVLGARGGIGGEVARQMRDAGWTIRALQRGLAVEREERDGIDRWRGDAMTRSDVLRAARGCAVIVHAVNSPGYRRSAELVLPMSDHTVAAAIAEQACIVLPGTIYNFGPGAFPRLAEDSPQHRTTRKGAIRVEPERRIKQATLKGARALIVRAGDFFGPRVASSWFSMGLVEPGKAVSTIKNPSRSGIGHPWSYRPDVARTVVELLAMRDRLDPFAVFQPPGTGTRTTRRWRPTWPGSWPDVRRTRRASRPFHGGWCRCSRLS